MARYTATVVWKRGDAPFADNRYSRAHRWLFDGGAEISASASPHIVPVPMSDESAVDPEEAFIASISSCHMLWFLSIAVKRGFVVDLYEDVAEGVLAKDERGRLAMTQVTLRPRVRYAERKPDKSEESTIHHEAHDACYIANSVRTEIVIEPREPS